MIDFAYQSMGTRQLDLYWAHFFGDAKPELVACDRTGGSDGFTHSVSVFGLDEYDRPYGTSTISGGDSLVDGLIVYLCIGNNGSASLLYQEKHAVFHGGSDGNVDDITGTLYRVNANGSMGTEWTFSYSDRSQYPGDRTFSDTKEAKLKQFNKVIILYDYDKPNGAAGSIWSPEKKKAPDTTYTVSGGNLMIGTLKQGEKFYFKGVVTAKNGTIRRTWGGIYTSDDVPVQEFFFDVGGSSFDIAKTFDYKLRMAQIPAGRYTYRIMVEDEKGVQACAVEMYFTIAAKETQPPTSQEGTTGQSSSGDAETTYSVSGEKSPSGTLKQGEKFYFKGVVTAQNGTIRSTWGGIYTPDCGIVQEYSFDVDAASFDIAKTFDYKLRMAKIPAGDYFYQVWAEDDQGISTCVIEKWFTLE